MADEKMADEWSPVAIEARLKELANENGRLIGIAQGAHGEALATVHAYDLAFARAYMAHVGPAHEKRYAAEIKTAEERTAMDAAEVAYRHVERMLRGKRDELDAIRSIGVSVRQAYGLTGV